MQIKEQETMPDEQAPTVSEKWMQDERDFHQIQNPTEVEIEDNQSEQDSRLSHSGAQANIMSKNEMDENSFVNLLDFSGGATHP